MRPTTRYVHCKSLAAVNSLIRSLVAGYKMIHDEPTNWIPQVGTVRNLSGDVSNTRGRASWLTFRTETPALRMSHI
jgi:hypothetical protein